MPTPLPPCPKTEVLAWDTRHVYLECPYCEEIHRHSLKLPGRRFSRCHPRGEYEFTYPIDESKNLVGYEIDKERAFFVSSKPWKCHQDDIKPLERSGPNLAHHFESTMSLPAREPDLALPRIVLRRVWEDLYKFAAGNGNAYARTTILSAIAKCILGDVHAIRQYLSTSPDVELFLHGRDEKGNTTLMHAAAEESHAMVSLLLEEGSDPNATNDNGRSALMQAALWGRLANVKVLLKADVNKHLRDHENRSAVNFALPTRRNQEERCIRMPYVENIPEHDLSRRHIVILLDVSRAENHRRFTKPPSGRERDRYSFRTSERSMTFCGPIHHCQVPPTKSFAILARGKQFKSIKATIGWPRKGSEYLIEQVRYIASVIGHELPPVPAYDHGEPGKYSACHAEKKLIAYFIDKHVFTPQDREPDRKLEHSISKLQSILERIKNSYVWKRICSLEQRKIELQLQLPRVKDERGRQTLVQDIRLVNEELSGLESYDKVAIIEAQEKKETILLEKNKLHQDLMKLCKKGPAISLQQAVIFSNKPICGNCEAFRVRVNDYFQLNIEVIRC